jgi:hypothetical protein
MIRMLGSQTRRRLPAALARPTDGGGRRDRPYDPILRGSCKSGNFS